MNITLIVAMDNNRGIGFKNTIPWMGKTPSDMKHFKEATTGHPVIMGRNTSLSIGKALPNRTNIILTHSDDFIPLDARVVHSFEQAIVIAQNAPGGDNIFVIGGAQTYRETIAHANRLMVTVIDGEFASDTYFPEIDMQQWQIESERFIQKEKDQFPLHFITYTRTAAP